VDFSGAGKAETRHGANRVGLVWLVASLVILSCISTAMASGPPRLWGGQPGEACDTGSGAAQCKIPRGIAADPSNGHIFVADSENSRTVEFNALGQFVKAWGWGVDTGAAALQSCTGASLCQAGVSGSGAGQFASFSPQGVAVDSAGNVYLADGGLPSNRRVQKFDRKGNFLLMFGGEVNRTKVEAGSASEGEENLCPFDPGDVCQGGSEGSGHGQFGFWPVTGDRIAIDDNGTLTTADDKVYVGDEGRIQRFDTEGHYQGEIPLLGKTVMALATDSKGNLYYIGDGELGVHKISPAGVPGTPETFELPKLGNAVPIPSAVAVDVSGDVFAFGPTNPGNETNPIFEFDPSGEVIAEFGKGEFTAQSTGLATNFCPGSKAPGNLYATNPNENDSYLLAYGTDPVGCFAAKTGEANPIAEHAATLNGTVNPRGLAVSECFFEYGTSTAYGHLAQCEDPDAGEIGAGSEPVDVHADISGLEKGTVYHFRLLVKVGGETETGADATFKTLGPPAITEDRAVSVTSSEATLKALVNPEGFETEYHFEYTTLAAFKESGFTGAQSTATTQVGGGRGDRPAVANLKGLTPGTAYSWRIVASNSSGTTEGAAHTLFTYLPFALGSCPANQALRGGASAFLPDCRAYELVSPVDKNGGDIIRGSSGGKNPGTYAQASMDGNRITYTSPASFAGQPNSLNFNQYLAARHERGEADEGWSSVGLHTPVAGQPVDPAAGTFGLFREFNAFSPDLCSAWQIDRQTPPPTTDGQLGHANLYRRENCGPGAGSFEALIPSPAYELAPGTLEQYVTIHSVQGSSADSRHTLFTARAQLTPDAVPSTDAIQLYDRFGGALQLVSVLPNGSAATGNSEVGGGAGLNQDRAVSADGSLVYWQTTNVTGSLLLRRHPEQGIVSEECSEAAKACTVPVSSGNAVFWTAATDGSKALYGEGIEGEEDLYEFDLGRYEAAEEPSRLIASHVLGVAGASEDLSRIYFVSSEALNDEEEGEEEGEPNLYLSEEEGEERTFSFVATLSASDVGKKEPGASVIAYNVVAAFPYERGSRVSADGQRLVFDSRAPLTGYDSSGEDGRPSVEVFGYQAASGELDCISCNPGGAQPSGVEEMREPYEPPWLFQSPTNVPAAAWIPTWEHPLHASNVVSADGGRVFFNASDALVPRDTNGKQDVYEWEAAGTGGCDTADPSYFAQNGGCIYLITSGESKREAEFWEASPDGRDVFFTTEASLVPQDPGSVDLYDARIDGGFPQPEAKVPCEGEACQSPPPPPEFAAPASGSYQGPPNPAHKRSCPKGKHKVAKKGTKSRCVAKKKGKKSQKRAGREGRAAR
jgi:DNA-binding beta-propeller fold protein YncE